MLCFFRARHKLLWKAALIEVRIELAPTQKRKTIKWERVDTFDDVMRQMTQVGAGGGVGKNVWSIVVRGDSSRRNSVGNHAPIAAATAT